MDLILRNARLIGAEQETTDIGIVGGRIADDRSRSSRPKARRSISAAGWSAPA